MTGSNESDRGRSGRTDQTAWRLTSEFARVSVALDGEGNGDRLRVTDLGSGAEIYLDPLELASLARSRHERLRSVIVPEEYLTETDEWALHNH